MSTAAAHDDDLDPADKPRRFKGRLIADQHITVTNLGDGLTQSKRVDGMPEFQLGAKYYTIAESTCSRIGYDDVEGTKLTEEQVKLKASTVFLVDADLVEEAVSRQKTRLADAALADQLRREEEAQAREGGQQVIGGGPGLTAADAEALANADAEPGSQREPYEWDDGDPDDPANGGPGEKATADLEIPVGSPGDDGAKVHDLSTKRGRSRGTGS